MAASAVSPPHDPPLELRRLSPDQLRQEQETTLGQPRRRYSRAAKALFWAMDVFYGRPRSLSKFKVLEVIARVPYQAWENVAYVAVTHRYSRPNLARRIFDRVDESRRQQDNEQWHLLILEELVDEQGAREPFVRFRLLPQVIAFVYYQLTWLLYVLRPAWSYRLNADFEDHAEHEYMAYVAEHPELEFEPDPGSFAAQYGQYGSLADLLRQIAHDERTHKQGSLTNMRSPRPTA
jgi:ubiquinol oxidase